MREQEDEGTGGSKRVGSVHTPPSQRHVVQKILERKMTRKRSAKSRAKRRAQAASGLAAAASRARGGNGDVREGDAVDADAGHDNKDSDSDAPQRHPALDYLQQWKHARESWKFQKNRQTYLLKHAFDSKKVPKSAFAILADYVRDLSGHAREVPQLFGASSRPPT